MASDYEAVIGLEVHVQVKTRSKIFCGCATTFGAEPNSQICPVCCGYPGVLPVLNRRVVEELVRTALALNGNINPHSVFARKQYFYPDLPKNYQISQYELPLAVGGYLDIRAKAAPLGAVPVSGHGAAPLGAVPVSGHGAAPLGAVPASGHGRETRRVRIHRIHLEEDAGKLLHAVGSRALDYSLVDLNRAGVPLMEIVSEPDLRTPEEAAAYLDVLRTLLRYVGVSDCDMEKGSMRCDANISIRPAGDPRLGTKAEVKNMNSLRSVRDAVAHEIARQIAVVEGGGRVVQETRLWDQDKGETRSMRSKEQAHDYRYFPDPDLVPLDLSAEFIQALRATLPELPEARRARYESELGLSAYDAGVLTAEKALADYFEAGLARLPEAGRREAAKPLSNWITTELLGRLNAVKKSVEESPVPAAHLADLAALVQGNEITGKAAKIVFEEMFQSGADPRSIVQAKGLAQVDDEAEIRRWVEEVLAANSKIVADIQGGKASAVGALVGQVLKKSGGRANPKTVQGLLKGRLGL